MCKANSNIGVEARTYQNLGAQCFSIESFVAMMRAISTWLLYMMVHFAIVAWVKYKVSFPPFSFLVYS